VIESIGKAKIGDDDFPMLVEQEVLELEIPVDDMLAM